MNSWFLVIKKKKCEFEWISHKVSKPQPWELYMWQIIVSRTLNEPDFLLLLCQQNHYGVLDGGHYTAYCKNAPKQRWYKFDDHEVSEISTSSVKSSAAYILFYSTLWRCCGTRREKTTPEQRLFFFFLKSQLWGPGAHGCELNGRECAREDALEHVALGSGSENGEGTLCNA